MKGTCPHRGKLMRGLHPVIGPIRFSDSLVVKHTVASGSINRFFLRNLPFLPKKTCQRTLEGSINILGRLESVKKRAINSSSTYSAEVKPRIEIRQHNKTDTKSESKTRLLGLKNQELTQVRCRCPHFTFDLSFLYQQHHEPPFSH